MRTGLVSIMATVISLGAAQAVSAADLPVRMPIKAAPMMVNQTWTGCYIGVNVGAGIEHTDVVDEITGAPIVSLGNTNVVGGGQIGCDYQFAGNWVVGVQGMIDASAIKASATAPLLAPATLNGSMPWFATATARLGYAVAPNWLIYAKGGGAWTHINANLSAAGAVVDTASFDQSGWTAGGGAEWMFARNWSVFAEYSYIDFTDKTVVTASGANLGTVKQNMQTALIGVNFPI
jgi:outer membrane immunogenic protein